MPRVKKNFDYTDVEALCIETLGWVNVRRGTLTLTPDGEGVMFIDEEGDQIVVHGERLVASALKPLPGDESEGGEGGYL